jgi:hypothetical protein
MKYGNISKQLNELWSGPSFLLGLSLLQPAGLTFYLFMCLFSSPVPVFFQWAWGESILFWAFVPLCPQNLKKCSWFCKSPATLSHAILSRSCLIAVTYKSVGSTQGERGKSGNKSLQVGVELLMQLKSGLFGFTCDLFCTLSHPILHFKSPYLWEPNGALMSSKFETNTRQSKSL